MENKKITWGVLGLILGVIIGLGVSKYMHSDRDSELGFGFGIELGPFGIDFGSRDYDYDCYYDEDGNYYCDGGGYYGGPYYYGYPGYYYYRRPYYHRNYGHGHGHHHH